MFNEKFRYNIFNLGICVNTFVILLLQYWQLIKPLYKYNVTGREPKLPAKV